MLRFHLPCLFLLFCGNASARADVRISQDAQGVVLANEALTVRVRGENGDFQITMDGLRVVERGYWSQVGRRQDGRDIARLGQAAAPVVTLDPATNGGARGEVAITFAPAGAGGGLPCEVEMRYTLARNERTLYVTSVWRHGPGMKGFYVGEARHAMKLNSAVFDYLAVDEKRHGPMPSGADWDRASPLNLKEARRITTGPLAGRVEHKYGYSAMIAETPAYGWVSTQKRCGVWLINPSAEYLAGGPTKMELTGHLDVNREGTPVLLNMWHGSHYGGSSLNIANDEKWSKVIGPFAVHCNAGKEPEALWRDGRDYAAEAATAWPVAWLKLPEYLPATERAPATGRMIISSAAAPVGRLRIGLAADPYQSNSRRGRDLVDWQRNSRDYQFWTTASSEGTFKLDSVRPGRYTLYAFAEGVPGEFSQGGFNIVAGQPLDCGTLTWAPERGRRILWQIGVADRSAGEFRRGNEAGTWGLYYQFAKDFPQSVNYTVGTSDWAKDWNYAHCGIASPGRRGASPTTWRVHFDLSEVPTAPVSLRLGIAGNRSPEGVVIGLNNQPAGRTGPMPDTAVMHRDAVRGRWFERSIPLPHSLLRTGKNTLTLTVPLDSWAEGVLYDFVRLEAAEGG